MMSDANSKNSEFEDSVDKNRTNNSSLEVQGEISKLG